jgi:hypothetical protein
MVFVSEIVEYLSTSNVAVLSRAGSLEDLVADSVVEDIQKLLQHGRLDLGVSLGHRQDLGVSEVGSEGDSEEVVAALEETVEDWEEVDMVKDVAVLATKAEGALEDVVDMEVSRMASAAVNHHQMLHLVLVARVVVLADSEDTVMKALRMVPAMVQMVVVGMATLEEVVDHMKIEALIEAVEAMVIAMVTAEEEAVAAIVSR